MKLSKFPSFNFHPSQKLNVCECVRKAKGLPCGVPSVLGLHTPPSIIPLVR